MQEYYEKMFNLNQINGYNEENSDLNKTNKDKFFEIKNKKSTLLDFEENENYEN